MPQKPAYSTQIFNEAVRLHQGGKLDEAALRYVLVLKTHPKSGEALHLLGVLRSRQGRHAEGLNHIRAALKLNSANALAFNDLGSILSKLSRPEEALASYDKALAVKPAYAEALYNRGIALSDLRRPEEALASFDRALAVKPDYIKALNNRGKALGELERPEDGPTALRKIILDPHRDDRTDVREGEGHHRDQRAIAQADEGGHVDRVEQFACMFACEYRGLAGLDDVLRSAHGMRRIRCKNRAKKGPAGIS